MPKQVKKGKKPINSIALLFFIVVITAVLTHFIPAGAYERITVDGRNVVDPGSFAFIESTPASLLDIFLAVPGGMTNAVSLIIGALLIGAGLEVIQASGAINIGISHGIKKIGVNRGDIILFFLFYMFALLGGFLGFIEGSIPFIPIAISIAIALGYDSITGVGIAMTGSVMGFTCGPTNPYTVGVSQTIAGLPMFSGIELRIAMFIAVPLICFFYIIAYSRKVRKNPACSLMKDVDVSDIKFDTNEYENMPFTVSHMSILLILVTCIGSYVFGCLNWGWNFNHLGAMFVIAGIFAGVISRFDINKITDTFVKGAQSMVPAAFIMGVAYGIQWILTKSNILDTAVYYLSRPLEGLSSITSLIGILIVIMLINFCIPSASGKAMVVMPIVLPIADIVGINAQTAILAYQFGDGITNLCTPLLGVLLLALGFGKVPFNKWIRFIMPLLGIISIVAILTLILASKFGYA